MNTLNDMIQKAMYLVKEIRKYAKDNNMLNSSIYLDFEDFLNKVSTMDPNE